jgi:dienelactone hydrolase
MRCETEPVTRARCERRRVVLLALLAGLMLGLGGGCAHVGLSARYTGPRELPAELAAYYSYPPRPIEATVQMSRQEEKYDILQIEFPSALNVFGSENIRVDYYRGRRPGRRPTVLLLPISGGIDFAVRSFARQFTANGIHCAIVHNRRVKIEQTQSAEEVEAYFRQTVLDNRQVLDYLVTRPEVDPNRLGCLGLSLGALKAVLLAAVDRRIQCAVVGLAGGSIADIALNSREKRLRNYIDQLQAMGVPSDMIHTELQGKVQTDPLRLAPYLDAGRTLLFLAAFDQVVPAWTGKQLRRALGRPQTIYLLAGHYTSYLYLPYAQWEALRFVKKKLDMN